MRDHNDITGHTCGGRSTSEFVNCKSLFFCKLFEKYVNKPGEKKQLTEVYNRPG